ncbi:hypothetical protein BKA62DRAFT_741550 [Auriculariales sp. MPI-PUGE-AT-0066]|nr:hypothetical protein BKA62DRAFT_741550 [Auriculariales sp. MPI-PUGE-AT-0066]
MTEALKAAPQWLAYLQSQNASAANCGTTGRRALKVSLADGMWRLSKEQRDALAPGDEAVEAALASFPDKFFFSDLTSSVVAKQKAIIVRTDFSNDAAWAKLRATIESDEMEGWKALSTDAEDAEEDLEDGSDEEEGDDEGGEEVDETNEQDAQTATNTAANASSSSSEVPDYHVFIFVEDASLFNGASNLRVLRALSDVRIVRSISRPLSHSGKAPAPNRLIGKDGLREVYIGPQVWVQDTQSNTDETLRVLLGAGAMYGTASADSWRAKASRAWELQINMDAGMTIDFGGKDNWTTSERARNLAEVEA